MKKFPNYEILTEKTMILKVYIIILYSFIGDDFRLLMTKKICEESEILISEEQIKEI